MTTACIRFDLAVLPPARVCLSQLTSSRLGKSSRECPPRDSVRFSAHSAITPRSQACCPFPSIEQFVLKIRPVSVIRTCLKLLPFRNFFNRGLHALFIAINAYILEHDLLHLELISKAFSFPDPLRSPSNWARASAVGSSGKF